MTIHRHDADAAPVHQDEFWGEHTEWGPQRRPSVERRAVASTIGRWWDGLLGGSAGAEHVRGDGHRAHGRTSVPHASIDPSPDRTNNAVGHTDRTVDDHPKIDPSIDVGDDAWTFEPEPQPVRRPGADPLLTRLGGLAVIVTLAAPLILGFTSSGSDSPSGDSLTTIASAPIAEPAAPAITPVADPAPTAVPATADTADSAPADASPAAAAAPVANEATTPVAATNDTASLEAAPDPEPATTELATTESAVAQPAVTEPASAQPASTGPASTGPASTGPACAEQYELAAGDYWIRIADAADVSLADLLAVNGASVDTMLVPGRSICLPVGASTPSPPPTTPATTTPATTTPATRTPVTRAPSRPTPTTVAPAPTTTTTTPAPARPAAVPESQATAIIRAVWPDDLEDRALEVAWRESNHRSNVNNFCCYGLFQIYFSVHRNWLSTIGVNSAQDLFDPQLNAEAAYMLYQRAGGFGPWGG